MSSFFAFVIGAAAAVGFVAVGMRGAAGKYTDLPPSFQSGGPGVFSADSRVASANKNTLSAKSLIAKIELKMRVEKSSPRIAWWIAVAITLRGGNL